MRFGERNVNGALKGFWETASGVGRGGGKVIVSVLGSVVVEGFVGVVTLLAFVLCLCLFLFLTDMIHVLLPLTISFY